MHFVLSRCLNDSSILLPLRFCAILFVSRSKHVSSRSLFHSQLAFPQVTTRGHSRSIFCKQSSMFDILVAEAWLASEHNSQNVQRCVTGVLLKEKMVCHTSPMQLQRHVAQLRSNTNTCTGTASAPQCRVADGQFPNSPKLARWCV